MSNTIEIRQRFYYQKDADGKFVLDAQGKRVKVYYYPVTHASAVLVGSGSENVGSKLSSLESGKVDKTDIVDNLTSSDSTKALSARCGSSLFNLASGKVDKVSGKGLSTNDYTNEDKAKLSELEGNAKDYIQIDVYADKYAYLKSNGSLNTNGTYRHCSLDLTSLKCEKIKMFATHLGNGIALFGFIINGEWVDGTYDVYQNKTEIEIDVPSNATEFRCSWNANQTNSFEIYAKKILSIKDIIKEANENDSFPIHFDFNVDEIPQQTDFNENLEFSSGLYGGVSVSEGSLFDPQKNGNTSWVCIKRKVYSGESYDIWGSASTNTKLYVITDSNNIVLSYCSVTTINKGTNIITITEDGYLYVNAIASQEYGAIKKQESYKSSNPFDIYNLYNSLMSNNEDYITRVDMSDADSMIGMSKPSYLDGIPMYMYKFIPKTVRTESSNSRKIKAMILTGVHSNEKFNIVNVYRLMKMICENWRVGKNAREMRSFVEFYIVPLVNPWGFKGVNSESCNNPGRCNYNGVNLNRNNNTHDWISGEIGQNYGGSSSCSEYETKVWNYYYNLINPDIFIDQHTPNMNSNGEFGIMEFGNKLKDIPSLGNAICRTITNNILINDSNVPTGFDVTLFDKYDNENSGTCNGYCSEKNTPLSVLLEVSDSSRWSNGVLTDAVTRDYKDMAFVRMQMQTIFIAWMYLIEQASKNLQK